MNSVVSHVKKLDWLMAVSSMLMVLSGLLSMYSSSLGREDFSNFTKQALFFAAGFCLMILISFFDWRLLRNDPYAILLLYAVGVAALAGLLFFAPEIRGVKGWYKIGNISIDPVEYIKIVLIVLMAKFFSMRHIEIYRIRHIFLSGLYFAIPLAIIFLKPDLGSCLVLSLVWVSILLVSGIKIFHFFVIALVGISIFSLGWSFALHDYQKDRILSFLEPELDPFGIGWSQLQSKIAIGNGNIWGQGMGRGTQTQYGFLSEPQTDFIFAALAEEFGSAGIALLFVFMALFLWRMITIGLLAQSNFPRLFAAGFATLFIVQTLVNVGMNLGLLPIVGLPLPLVSYGGSSLIMSYIGLGILQSIKTHEA